MPLLEHQPLALYGKTLHRSRATNGFAGSPRARKRRREVSESRRGFRSSKVECGGRAVGQVAPIVETAAKQMEFLDML
mgnify:CR=1 FL=1